VYESQAKHRDSLQALFSKETSSSAGGSQLQQLDQRLAALKSSLVQQRAALDSAQWSARTRVADAVLAVQDDTKDLKALQVVATKLSGAGVNTAASALNQLLSQATAQQGKNQEEVRAAQKVLKATASQAEAIAQVEVQYNTTRLIKAKLMSRQLSAKKSQGVLKSALAAADAYLSDIQDICNTEKKVQADVESAVMPALREVAAKSPPPALEQGSSDAQPVPSMSFPDSSSGDGQMEPSHKVASLAVLSKPSVRSSAVFSRLTSGTEDGDDDSSQKRLSSLSKGKGMSVAHLNLNLENNDAHSAGSGNQDRKIFQMECDWDDDDDAACQKTRKDDTHSAAAAVKRLSATLDDGDDDDDVKGSFNGHKPASRLLKGLNEPDILPANGNHKSSASTTTTTTANATTTTPIAAVARLQAAFDSDAPDPDPSPTSGNGTAKAGVASTTISAFEAAIYEAATATTTNGLGIFSASMHSGFDAAASPFSFSAAATTTTTTTTSKADTADASGANTGASFDEVAQDFDEFDNGMLMEISSKIGRGQLRRSSSKDSPSVSNIVLDGYADVLKNKALRQLAETNPTADKLEGFEDSMSKKKVASDSSAQAQTDRWCLQQGPAGLSRPVGAALEALDKTEISLAEVKASKKAVGLEVKTLKKVQESLQQDLQGLSAIQAWVLQEGTSLSSRLEAWQVQAPQDAPSISSAARASATAHSTLLDAISKVLAKRNAVLQAQQATLSQATSEEANAEQLLVQAVERRNQAVAALEAAKKASKRNQANCDNAHVSMELKKRHMQMKLRAMRVAVTVLNAK
jgi:hypothetical protein